MIRNLHFAKPNGQLGFMSPMVWMFISSYENLRTYFIDQAIIYSLIQLEYNASGEVRVPLCAFILSKQHIANFIGSYIRLTEFPGYDVQSVKTLEALKNPECGWFFTAKPDDFKKIPGSPIAYWIKGISNFDGLKLSDLMISGGRTKTHGNDKYIRYFWEISNIIGSKWEPYANGGEFRKFYGNEIHVVDWSDAAKSFYSEHGGLYNNIFWGTVGITWSLITSSLNSFRVKTKEAHYSSGSPTIFTKDYELDTYILGFLNSKITSYYLKAINPTLNTTVGDVLSLPLKFYKKIDIEVNIKKNIEISKYYWNCYETSWNFIENPLIRTHQPNLRQAFNIWQKQNADAVAEMKRLEEENNKLFIEAYGLQDELTPDVPDERITLTRADREKDSQRLVSYALGCMMGRYSLDEPGLIYAHAGNQDFDASRYQKFPADADGIIPLTEMHWFEDDATHRIQEFLTAVWGKDTLDANMQWLAESLDKKASETAEDTIRRYLASKFYKDHMQTYKKRPIYWLFSSGKQGAFQALVYLHRYNESTLARMRTEYVMPLISKMAAYANLLETAKENSDSAAEIKRKEKELQNLHKQQAELSSFEEKLRHYADQRISLDLDDGVKVNYGKFGDLLAEVKAITGEK